MDDKFQTGVDATYVAHTRFLWQEADKSPSYQPARTRNGGEGDSQQVLQLAAKQENCLLAIFCTKCGWSTLWRHGKMHRQKKPTQDSRWEERRNYPSEVVPSRSEKRQIEFVGLPPRSPMPPNGTHLSRVSPHLNYPHTECDCSGHFKSCKSDLALLLFFFHVIWVPCQSEDWLGHQDTHLKSRKC